MATASALSLSVTVTNWMAGLISTALGKPPRRAIVITLSALAAIFVLVVIQRALLPGSNGSIFNPKGIMEAEKQFILADNQGGPGAAARVFFLTSAVMPRIDMSRTEGTAAGRMFTIQASPPGSSGTLGLVATVLWGFLLIAGVAAIVRGTGNVRFRIALGATLLGQLGLHLLYGAETFLYALNYTPLLVLSASLATLGRFRYAVLAAAILLLPCQAVNNVRQLRSALDAPRKATPDLP